MKYVWKKCAVILMTLVLAVSTTLSMTRSVEAATTPKKIVLNKTSTTLTVGGRLTLKVKSVTPKKASKKVKWKSSNTKVATVTSKGIVRAKKKGTVTITARSTSGKAVARCKIRVKAKTTKKKRVLVAYFSGTGTTKGVAEKIAKATGGTLYEIEPQDPYTEDDLDYNNNNCRANKEMSDETSRPKIKTTVKDMSSYDVVYLGFPIWWGTAPRIIDTFVESYSFTGKTVIPFCTSGGSGIDTASSDLEALCKGKPIWKTGRRFEGNVSQTTINTWVKSVVK